METSQLFLCQKFTRLHVTKCLALPLLPSPSPHYPPNRIHYKPVESHKLPLPSPHIVQKKKKNTAPGFGESSTTVKARVTILVQDEARPCGSKPSRHTHFLFLLHCDSGPGATWLLSACTFQVFLQ